MELSLIDTLLDEKPIIDRENKTIKSEISLTNLFLGNSDKSEIVIFHRYVQEYHNNVTGGRCKHDYYEKIWKGFDLPDFYVSKKLVNFFINQENSSAFRWIFTLNDDYITSKKQWVEIFSVLLKFNHLTESEQGYITFGKQRLRFGKFIRTFLDILPISMKRYFHIETFVDIYKSRFNNNHRVCLLTGEDIKLGYIRSYQTRGSTMLNDSCMNDKVDVLDLYTKNPKIISLFVITNEQGKIISRNLVWKIKKFNNYYFDRIYFADGYIKRIVLDLIKQEGWMSFEEKYTYRKINEKGDVIEVPDSNLSVKLNFNGVDKFPYLDTFRYNRLFSRRITNEELCIFYRSFGHTDGSASIFLIN